MTKGIAAVAAALAAALALSVTLSAEANDEAGYGAACRKQASDAQCDCMLGEVKSKLSPTDYQAFLKVSVAETPAKGVQVMRSLVADDQELKAMGTRIAMVVQPALGSCGFIQTP